MSTFTKEQLIEKLQHRISVASGFPESEKAQIDLELARIALASLEAEAVCVIDQPNLDYLKSGADADVWPASRTEMGDVLLYRASPPAPANAEPVAWLWSHRKHPSEVTLVRPEDDERAEGAHWSGWSCQALYAAPPVPVSVPDAIPKLKDGRGLKYVKDGVCYSVNYANGWNQCRAAMLQELKKSAGTEAICRSDKNVQVLHTKSPAQSDCCPAQNHVSPEQNGDTPAQSQGWIQVSEQMPIEFEAVIAFDGDQVYGEAMYSSDDGFTIDGYEPCDRLNLQNVTHWMPLPAAPQEVKGE